ncbi:peptidase M20 [Cytophagales bacterium WSM2-2]|nr:peptidase M20 [Cytophagales bacterium WSM2-2]
MKIRIIAILVAITGSPFFSEAQSKIQKYIADQSNQTRWLTEYAQFLSIPNVLGDSVNIVKNAQHISDMLNRLGVKSELLISGKPNSAPVVFGSVTVPGATQTVAFYAHYDGQPVNPRQWAEGLQPFVPVLFSDRLDKGGKKIPFPSGQEKVESQWRLYARGSSDDKAGVFAIITAYEALIKNGLKPTVNIKFFFEGEEEAGSINLAEIFSKYKEKLGADLWLICDGPRHISGKKQVVFGVRGDVNLDLKVYASKRPLHSGNYGNWAPNPGMRLAQLLASMKDANGNVLIDKFYDDVMPFSETEKTALAKIPRVESLLQEDLALGKPDGNGKTFTELLTLPTLNINGMQSGNVGAMATNVIPTEASAVLDLRLVLGNDVDRQIGKVKEHIIRQGYTVIDHEPSDAERRQYPLLAKLVKRKGGYNAQRTPMDLPIAQKVSAAIETTVNYEVIKVPSLGGSLPLFLFEQMLMAKPITVPIVNYDNNQHAENENVILQYLWDGIETMAAIMTMK